MKPKILPIAILALLGSRATAAVGVVESTGQFQVNSSTVYLSPIPGNTSNSTLNGYNFGSFNPAVDTLQLTNWYLENYAYNAGTGSDNWINGDNSATLLLEVGLNEKDQVLTRVNSSGNNHFWNNSFNGPVNLLEGLGNGTYTLKVSVSYTYNDWNGSSASTLTSTGNSLATATFTVIPEPAAALLGSLGMLLLMRRRR